MDPVNYGNNYSFIVHTIYTVGLLRLQIPANSGALVLQAQYAVKCFEEAGGKCLCLFEQKNSFPSTTEKRYTKIFNQKRSG